MMMVHRRELLKAGAVLAASASFPNMVSAEAAFAPTPGAWRRFRVTTKLDIDKPVGAVRAWIPLPGVNEANWSRSGQSAWMTNADHAQVWRDPGSGAPLLHAEWR